MNEDKGIKKAIKERPQLHLPNNFTYRTMQKIEEARALRERKEEQCTLWSIIIVSLFLIGGCIVLYGESIKSYFTSHSVLSLTIDFSPLYIIFAIIPTLILFDQWMRKEYFKRHPHS